MLTWLSIDIWLISLLSLAYLLVLFFVAYWGENQTDDFWKNNAWIYSLSIGVSCTSWAFYGIIGQAAVTGQWLSHIYIGTMACFILAWPMLLKLLRVSKQQNITSIADFIASRYDKAPYIAALVTLIALLGTIPYIALQLRAISQSFDLVTSTYRSGTNTTLIVAIVLSIFGILFGARHAAATKQNQGLIFAIAFSSVVKLMAITAIGIFVTYVAFDGFSDLINKHEAITPNTDTQMSVYLSFSQILLGFLTIFLTPQLYHVIVIENNSEDQLKKARWMYPAYLVLINIFVLPIALAGEVTFPGGGVNADTFILSLPLSMGEKWLSVFVFIGGLAAATGMVIVAAVVLSTMFTTEILTPAILKFSTRTSRSHQFSVWLLNARRFSIIGMMLLALLFERLVSQQSHLSSMGVLSLVLLSQCAPAVIGALYWRSASSNGAVVGLMAGTLLWFYCLLLPILWPESALINDGLLSISWLRPTSLFGIEFLDDTSHGIVVSLFFNTLCYILVSINSQRTVGEKIQAEIFLKTRSSALDYELTVNDLYQLLNRFVDQETALHLLHENNQASRYDKATTGQVEFTHKKLASVMGTASTRLVMSAATKDSTSNVRLEDVATIVDEANELFKFNRELLQAGVENIEQGISVVDADMRLVAWNQRYIELLEYPPDLVKVGMPISELIRFNAKRNILTGDNIDEMCRRRLAHMRAGHSHYFQRVFPSGLVIEIRGQAMPGGGFVSTFSDITQHIESEKALQLANETLEQNVHERTQELSLAKAEAEAANSSKTRFLAAASHDLMQPFNALSLFTDMLLNQVKGSESEKLAMNIQQSLGVVEGLISDLVEISKLEATKQSVDIREFQLEEVMLPLINEFELVAEKEGIRFNSRVSRAWVKTDKRLIRRILQNFLSNAIHYSPLSHSSDGPRILFGVKRLGDQVQLQVWDNGPGIPEEKQAIIFKEFERLEQNRDMPGLGLGLAISDRIASILGLTLGIKSSETRGTVFYLQIPVHKISESEQSEQPIAEPSDVSTNGQNDPFRQLTILLIDNDELLLSALQQQLAQWSDNVIAVKGRDDWFKVQAESNVQPDVIFADYHLDDGDNGIDLAQEILKYGSEVPVIICSADASEWLREAVSEAHFSFIRKPIKALALRKLIKQLTSM